MNRYEVLLVLVVLTTGLWGLIYVCLRMIVMWRMAFGS